MICGVCVLDVRVCVFVWQFGWVKEAKNIDIL